MELFDFMVIDGSKILLFNASFDLVSRYMFLSVDFHRSFSDCPLFHYLLGLLQTNLVLPDLIFD